MKVHKEAKFWKMAARLVFTPRFTVPVGFLLWLKQDHRADLQVLTNATTALQVMVTQESKQFAHWYITGSVNLVSPFVRALQLQKGGWDAGGGEHGCKASAQLFIKMHWPYWLTHLSCKWDDDLWRRHEWLWWSLPVFLMQSSGLEVRGRCFNACVCVSADPVASWTSVVPEAPLNCSHTHRHKRTHRHARASGYMLFILCPFLLN